MATIYQFGKFVLNVHEQLFTADGRAVHLPTKEFEILQMLVENNGRVLSKDEMMSTIWKDTFVEESNLAQYISRLRKVLNVDGNQYIKTISKRGYRFSAEVRTSDGDLIVERQIRLNVDDRETRGLGEIKSVAVLPFQSFGSRVDDEFFGLGIADALITQLTRSGTVITTPTASVSRFREPDQDPVAIAALLNVDAILEGNFQRSGNRLRLTAQMRDSDSGNTLWAESFNTEFDDIFEVQDSIARRIVSAFNEQYSAETRRQLTKHYTENKEAYEEYLKGRFNFSKRTGDSLTKALQNFQTAIEIDHLYALAYAGIAETYQLLPLSDEMEPHVAFPKAKAAVLRALQIDDSIPEAHVSLGAILMDFDWNWLGAELSFQKAIELNPNYAAAHQVYGTLLLRLGRIGDAIIELKKAQALDPLSPAINTWMAEACAHLGEHEAAIRIHRETIKFAPDYLFAQYFLVQSYVDTGRISEAAKAAEEAIKLSDDMSLTRSASIFLKAHTGDQEGARDELNDLIRKKENTYVSAVNIASGFAVLGERDAVFKWLETAIAERDSNLTWLNMDREFDALRDDPRFHAIVGKVGLPLTGESRIIGRSDAAVGNPRSRTNWTRPVFAGVAAIAAALVGYWGLSQWTGSHPATLEKNTLIRLTDGPTDDSHPTFSKDGRIRFGRVVDKQLVSFVMSADGTGVSEVPDVPGLTFGAWSPDGSKVFYNKGTGDPGFYLANSDGSNERVMSFHPGNVSWSHDSTRLVYQAKSRDGSIPNNSDIFIFDLQTETVTPVVESPFFDSDPAFSPDGQRIVYVSDVEGNFEIYSRVITTGETTRLTHNIAHDSFPSFSPDGTQIIFNSDREKENNDVYLMNADGSGLRKITDGPGWDASPPNAWSPDGTRVLLLSDRDGGKEHIYLMNIEPYVPRLVTSKIESEEPLAPSYAPDGDRILYLANKEIRIFETGSKTDRIIFRTAEGADPTFSPDGRKILFQDRISENTEVCTVDIDGSGFVNLTQSQSRDMSPSFSPDGKKIAFSSNRAASTTTFEIYVMNSDGSEPSMIFGDRAMSAGPSWSPDGKSVVFANDREDGRIGNFELFSIDIEGGKENRLTIRPRYDTSPVFSPDGRRIAFASNTDGNSEIYLMNADGTGTLRLTRDLGNDVSPRWSPDGKRLIFSSNRTGKYEIYEIVL